MMGAQWEQIRAGEILTAIEGEWFGGSPETVISRVSTDSRNIGEGSLFWALEGERFDGHDYAEQAVEKGAAGVVVRQGYERLSGNEKQPVVEASTSCCGGSHYRERRQNHDKGNDSENSCNRFPHPEEPGKFQQPGGTSPHPLFTG